MHTGSIVDFYDDPQGLVLRSRLPQDSVPDFIKQAEYLTEGTRAKLPDDVFALVMVDQGERLRKYACTDKGNTALSVIYFMENKDRLPEEAQKVAAANLTRACAWYDLKAPLPLFKVAGLGGFLKAGVTAVGVKGMAQQGLQKHRALMGKVGDLTGSEIMPLSSSTEKTAALRPYVDVTSKEPPAKIKQASAKRYCMVKEGQARFPIDSYGQVQQAIEYFEKYASSMHPADRRTYCSNLAPRAEELGIEVPYEIKKYGSPKLAPDGEVKVAIATRMQFWTEDSPERDLLKGLMAKYASVHPDVLCAAIQQFDTLTGLQHMWDDAIYDPWYSTYGFTKTAEWTWQSGNDRLTEDQLQLSAKKDFDQIKKTFGCEVAEEYRKNPQQIFDSLPLDSKRIIARMANDPQ
jgi:hypothetical protein